MPLIIGVILLAAIGYSAYWHYAARILDREVTALLADHPHLDVKDTSLRGFPYRFDLTLDSPHLSGRNTAMSWTAPFLNLHALAYRPHHVIAVFPPDQMVTLGAQGWQISSPDARASIIMTPTTPVQLERANLVFETPEFSDGTQSFRADSLRAALRQGDAAATHEFAVELHGLSRDPALVEGFGSGSTLPPIIARIALRGTVAIDGLGPDIGNQAAAGSFTLTGFALQWGDISLDAEGALYSDRSGQWQGEGSVVTAQPQAILDLMTAAHLLTSDQTQAGAMIMAMLQDRDTGRLSLPLVVRDSVVYSGPLMLGRLSAP